jgi:hypothetical protein
VDINNPWRQLPHDTYEKHMGHENVRQLETLSRIFSDQLALVTDIQKPTIAILGITGGNGLENIKAGDKLLLAGRYKAVIGIDINEEYLSICRNRYIHLPELELYQIDLMTEKERAVKILKQADFITANLIVKHIHLDNFIDIVGKLHKSVVSVTVQFNPDGISLSHSGYEAAFEDIQKHGQNHDEAALTAAMCEAGYSMISRKEYELPNKKLFIRLDYKRRDITIRLATVADAEELAVMNKQLIEDEKHDNPMTMPELKERMAGFLSGDYDALFCVDENAAILGYALVNVKAKPIYLRQFFMCRDRHRKGYGHITA